MTSAEDIQANDVIPLHRDLKIETRGNKVKTKSVSTDVTVTECQPNRPYSDCIRAGSLVTDVRGWVKWSYVSQDLSRSCT